MRCRRAVCLDARRARASRSLQINKSGANDALGLTQIVRTGWFREVRVKSLDSHRIRTLLTARAQLVAVKVDVGNQIRGMLKTFGHLVGVARGPAFEARVRELVDGDPGLAGVVGSPSRLAHYPS